MRPSIEAVWRLEATRLIGALLRAGADVALAEDCVQDALVSAMQRWPTEGRPERPGARLMFLACHPKLARQAQLALTLRLVAGLTAAEIARAMFAKEATIAQRITRAKAQLAGEPFELPPALERAVRLNAICATRYLMFNEGYVASSGAQWTRPTEETR